MSDVSMVNGHDDAVVQGDLISRSALINWHKESIEWLTNLIRKTEYAEVQSLATREKGAFMESLRFIEKAPAVDAVPVVRCKDCKHYAACKRYGDLSRPNDDDFCSYGERRDEDGK